MSHQLLLYCRRGFEKEGALEITEKASSLGVFGFAKVIDDSAYVLFECYQQEADFLAQRLEVNQLIFARQLIVVGTYLSNLSQIDRISPISAGYQQIENKKILQNSTALWVESADTNEGKSLSTFCRKFTVPLRQQLKQQGYLLGKSQQAVTLHIFFIESTKCYIGYSYNALHSPHYMGIMRLKFPSLAPSRSTLKLEEAIHTFIPKKEQEQRLNASMYAVDLGACPGGWTYQLVRRGLFVFAVDHGAMAKSLHDTGRIEHCLEDGFKFTPPKKQAITWLVCDMVEKPSKITQLILKWLVSGWCQETIFNLKLPMKKRYLEVKQCLHDIQDTLEKKGLLFSLQAKHLYHDREEITVHIRLYQHKD